MAGPSLTLNLTGEWVRFHNTQPVTITNPDGTSTTIANALKHEAPAAPTVDAGGVQVPVFTCKWLAWLGQLGTFVPVRHGYVTEADGTKWYIDAVSRLALESRIDMDCTLQADTGLR
jgi:hypothetical protein